MAVVIFIMLRRVACWPRAALRLPGVARGLSQSVIQYRLVEAGEVRAFIERCLVASGALELHAASLASTLTHADLRGHYSHGLNRLGKSGSTLCFKSLIILFKHF